RRLPKLINLLSNSVDHLPHTIGKPIERRQDRLLAIEARRREDLGPPSLERKLCGSWKRLTKRVHEGIDRFRLRLARKRDVLLHPSREPRLGEPERDRMKVTKEHVPVPEAHRGRRNLARDHLLRSIVEVSVVRRASRVSEDDAHAAS